MKKFPVQKSNQIGKKRQRLSRRDVDSLRATVSEMKGRLTERKFVIPSQSNMKVLENPSLEKLRGLLKRSKGRHVRGLEIERDKTFIFWDGWDFTHSDMIEIVVDELGYVEWKGMQHFDVEYGHNREATITSYDSKKPTGSWVRNINWKKDGLAWSASI